jgi:hypothetical protein
MARVPIRALRRVDFDFAITPSFETEIEPAASRWARPHGGMPEACPEKCAVVIFTTNRKRVQHETAAKIFP